MNPDPQARTRDKILFFLKTKGPQTAGSLSDRLKVTDMAIRQHLQVLQDEGLVAYHDRAEGVGRPSRYWTVTPAADSKFPDSHGELTVGIIQAVRTTFGEEGLDKLIAERTRNQQEAYIDRIPGGKPLGERVRALASVRSDEGYMAESERQRDGSYLLIENHCPICIAATTCQGLCRGELNLFNAVLGDDVTIERTEYMMEGARRCTYRITPNPSTDSP